MEVKQSVSVPLQRSTLPAGQLTFLFTDVQGSTRMFQLLGPRYVEALQAHRQILREALEESGGVEVSTSGDSFFAVFDSADAALACSARAQRDLVDHEWPEDGRLLVRMGLHTGDAAPFGGDYVSLVVHQAARVSAAAQGGQVLLSAATASASAELPPQTSLRPLGEHVLRDFDQPVPLLQLVGRGMLDGFIGLRTASSEQHNLPLRVTPFIGRTADVDRVTVALRSSRCVSIIGAGGLGKTRLAIEAVEPRVAEFSGGVVFVELASLRQPWQVVQKIAEACAIGTGTSAGIEAVIHNLRERAVLLVLDNCEHLLEPVAECVDSILRGTRRVRVLATSRAPLRIDGETVVGIARLSESEAARLLVSRAEAAGGAIVDDESTRAAVRALCDRVDGMPLALELLAVRAATSTLSSVAERFHDDAAPTRRGGDPRQRSVEATVSWSWDLLDDGGRMAWKRLSVLSNGATVEMATTAITYPPLSPTQASQAVSRLIEESVLSPVPDQPGRFRLLEPIREHGLAELSPSELSTAQLSLARALAARFRVPRPGDADLSGLSPHLGDLLIGLRAGELDVETRREIFGLTAALLLWGFGTLELARELLGALCEVGGVTTLDADVLNVFAGGLRHFGLLTELRALLDEWLASEQAHDPTGLLRVELAYSDLEVYENRDREAHARRQRILSLAAQSGVEVPALLWERLGETAAAEGRWEEAVPLLQLCLAHSCEPKVTVVARHMLACTYIALGRLTEAHSILQEFRREGGASAGHDHMLAVGIEAELRFASGELKEAEEHARHHLKSRLAEGKPVFVNDAQMTLLRVLAAQPGREREALDAAVAALDHGERELPHLAREHAVLDCLAAHSADEALASTAWRLLPAEDYAISDPVERRTFELARERHGDQPRSATRADPLTVISVLAGLRDQIPS